jgi:type IV secretory pathway VirB10-like protein
MPSFLDKLKSGADKAAFEADRLVRVNQAQSALKNLQREMETEVEALGKQALALYDAGALTQSELLALMPQIEAKRQQIADQEAEVERIRQDKPAEASTPAPDRPAAGAPAPYAAAPPPAPVATGRACPNCGAALAADVRFCPECGSKVEDA